MELCQFMKFSLNPLAFWCSISHTLVWIGGVMQFFKPSLEMALEIPLALFPVQAGFPSPAEESADKQIDLNAHLIKHPASTFFARVSGDSMVEKGLFSGDLVVVDKSLEPKNGDIIIAILNSEFTVKEFRQDSSKKIYLIPHNKNYKNIEIKIEDSFEVWGVVTSLIRSYLSRAVS